MEILDEQVRLKNEKKRNIRKKFFNVMIVLAITLNLLPNVSASAAVNTAVFKRSEAALDYFQMKVFGNYVTFKKPDAENMYIGNLLTGKLTKTKYPYDEQTKLNGMHDNTIIITNGKTKKYTAYGKEYEKKLYGYISTDNKVLYEPQFTDVTSFKHGYAAVSWPKNGVIYTAIIDKKGNKKVITETSDVSKVVYGKKYVCFPIDLGRNWDFSEDSIFICYDMDGNFIDYVNGFEAQACQYADYSHKKYQEFVKDNKSKYEHIEYAGYGNYVCRKDNNSYLITQDGKKVKTFKDTYVNPVITSDDVTVYLRAIKNEKMGAYSLTGQSLVPIMFSALTYTDDNGFYGVTDGSGKEQYIYNSTGKEIYHYKGSTPVTVLVDGLPTTFRSLDFWEPTHMYAYYNVPSNMKNISTSNLKQLKAKVKKVPNTVSTKKANELSKAVLAKSSAPCLEVWTNELVMDWFIYYQ